MLKSNFPFLRVHEVRNMTSNSHQNVWYFWKLRLTFYITFYFVAWYSPDILLNLFDSAAFGLDCEMFTELWPFFYKSTQTADNKQSCFTYSLFLFQWEKLVVHIEKFRLVLVQYESSSLLGLEINTTTVLTELMDALWLIARQWSPPRLQNVKLSGISLYTFFKFWSACLCDKLFGKFVNSNNCM